MKRLVLSALAAVACFTLLTPVKAQEYAPLIQPETVSIMRLNLDQIKPDTLSAQVGKVANAAIDYFVDDAEKAEEIKQTVPLANIFIAQYYSTFVEPLSKAGVSNVYFVVDQPKDSTETFYPYIAIPTKALSKEQLAKAREAMTNLNKQLDSAIKYRFVRNDFLFTLIVPDDVDEADVKKYVKDRFTKLNTVENASFTEGFALAKEDDILTAVSLPAKNTALAAEQLETVMEQIDKFSTEVDGASDVAKELKDFIQFSSDLNQKCADLVKFNVVDVNVNDLEITSSIVTNSADAAKDYLKLVNELIDKVNSFLDVCVSVALENTDSEANIDADEVKAAIASFKDLLAAFLKMDADNEIVVWKMNEKFWTDNKDSVSKFVGQVKSIAEKVVPDEALLDEEDDLDGEIDVEDEDVIELDE